MAVRSTDFSTDVFARAIPGQSLTDTPGKNPYEKPAMTSSPREAMDVTMESLSQKESQENIVNLLDAGISAETISSAFVMKLFSEGVFTPDVAESIKAHMVDAFGFWLPFVEIQELNVDMAGDEGWSGGIGKNALTVFVKFNIKGSALGFESVNL